MTWLDWMLCVALLYSLFNIIRSVFGIFMPEDISACIDGEDAAKGWYFIEFIISVFTIITIVVAWVHLYK